MRLINATTLRLEEFFSDPPSYLILSHTWFAGEEITFQDMNLISGASSYLSQTPEPAAVDELTARSGYQKIVKACEVAKQRDLDYAWVDTCCIDKTSSAELTESINSMYAWYRDAAVCVAFLQDFSSASDGDGDDEGLDLARRLDRCRWFTRGWTLQELLAPREVYFYDGEWREIVSRGEFVDGVARVTGIPAEMLRREKPLEQFSVAARMSWAALRQTTRLEDGAYCLLGIFGVNMPLIYGEGKRAFRRLQEEIIKMNNDLTVFAHERPHGTLSLFADFFAAEPSAFIGGRDVVPFHSANVEFTVTNKGIRLSGYIPWCLVEVHNRTAPLRYMICLGHRANRQPIENVGIGLRKIGPDVFARDWAWRTGDSSETVTAPKWKWTPDIYISNRSDDDLSLILHSFRQGSVHIPEGDGVCDIKEMLPDKLWDHTDRMFLAHLPYSNGQHDTVLVVVLAIKPNGADDKEKEERVFVTLDRRQDETICRSWVARDHPHESQVLRQQMIKPEGILWADLLAQAPKIRDFGAVILINRGSDAYEARFELVKERLPRKAQLFPSLKWRLEKSKSKFRWGSLRLES